MGVFHKKIGVFDGKMVFLIRKRYFFHRKMGNLRRKKDRNLAFLMEKKKANYEMKK
jgi:methylphosphotriester-DNA--protein-cysteine methyltransferase